MKGKLGDKQRLIHILESIEEIEKYTAGENLENFVQNSMMKFASVKQIEIIGEAANHIVNTSKTDPLPPAQCDPPKKSFNCWVN